MIYWFFGYPGVGKDYLANLLSKIAPVKHIDADTFLTKIEKSKIEEKTFTNTDRLKKLKRISKILKTYNTDIAIGDSLPDSKSREFLSNYFKDKIIFILVKTSPKKHRIQLENRKNHFFKIEMLNNYLKNWDSLKNFPHLVLDTTKLNKIKLENELVKIYKFLQ